MGNIVWLASYPKSGNTWLRAFLANLMANRPTPVALAELPNYGRLEAEPELYSRIAGRPSTDLDFAQLCALRPQVHAAIAATATRTVFVKTHSMAGIVDGVPLLTPQVSAGSIYVVRNPLDVAISMSHHFGIDQDAAIDYLNSENSATENSEMFVTEFLGSWSQHVKSWADMESERILILRYEDLLEKPAKWFGKVARMVGTEDRTRIERAIRHCDFRALAEMEKRDGFVEVPIKGKRFFRAGRSNQWREKLSREQVARIIAAHREQMQRFGYVPGGY
ncbi:MAG: sulfotransferase domain-containing protein [Proteobacteria bacterium]|uniref:sulfotransferase domain-containing protein n=1 Tax=Rudaea sp. TaxID=2136325 RepID=UPI001E02A1DD|nr:sulfotransferase domain-containing protein [Pseudomonadota bacterium]MBS0566758.1 sulfotransferase domain-containing protein [Pseudomonadota bacterium]